MSKDTKGSVIRFLIGTGPQLVKATLSKTWAPYFSSAKIVSINGNKKFYLHKFDLRRRASLLVAPTTRPLRSVKIRIYDAIGDAPDVVPWDAIRTKWAYAAPSDPGWDVDEVVCMEITNAHVPFIFTLTWSPSGKNPDDTYTRSVSWPECVGAEDEAN